MSTDNTRAKKSGLSADIQKKLEAKYNIEQEKQCRQWIEEVTGSALSNQQVGMHCFQECLKDGQVLCHLINKLNGSDLITKINGQKMAFKQMENIEKFLTACKTYGLKDGDLFQTADLYECQNMSQVVTCIFALGSVAQKEGYEGAVIGAKISQGNKRDFTDEQLKQGESIIGCQMGGHKGASQAGMNIGKTRSIVD